MNLTSFLGLLDLDERKRFCKIAGTKHTHLWQLLGGHRSPSLRMLWSMVRASRRMYPRTRANWLTLDEVHGELLLAQRRRARIAKANAQGASV